MGRQLRERLSFLPVAFFEASPKAIGTRALTFVDLFGALRTLISDP